MGEATVHATPTKQTISSPPTTGCRTFPLILQKREWGGGGVQVPAVQGLQGSWLCAAPMSMSSFAPLSAPVPCCAEGRPSNCSPRGPWRRPGTWAAAKKPSSCLSFLARIQHILTTPGHVFSPSLGGRPSQRQVLVGPCYL